jgi:hypothetical protein
MNEYCLYVKKKLIILKRQFMRKLTNEENILKILSKLDIVCIILKLLFSKLDCLTTIIWDIHTVSTSLVVKLKSNDIDLTKDNDYKFIDCANESSYWQKNY